MMRIDERAKSECHSVFESITIQMSKINTKWLTAMAYHSNGKQKLEKGNEFRRFFYFIPIFIQILSQKIFLDVH